MLHRTWLGLDCLCWLLLQWPSTYAAGDLSAALPAGFHALPAKLQRAWQNPVIQTRLAPELRALVDLVELAQQESAAPLRAALQQEIEVLSNLLGLELELIGDGSLEKPYRGVILLPELLPKPVIEQQQALQAALGAIWQHAAVAIMPIEEEQLADLQLSLLQVVASTTNARLYQLPELDRATGHVAGLRLMGKQADANSMGCASELDYSLYNQLVQVLSFTQLLHGQLHTGKWQQSQVSAFSLQAFACTFWQQPSELATAWQRWQREMVFQQRVEAETLGQTMQWLCQAGELEYPLELSPVTLQLLQEFVCSIVPSSKAFQQLCQSSTMASDLQSAALANQLLLVLLERYFLFPALYHELNVLLTQQQSHGHAVKLLLLVPKRHIAIEMARLVEFGFFTYSKQQTSILSYRRAKCLVAN